MECALYVYLSKVWTHFNIPEKEGSSFIFDEFGNKINSSIQRIMVGNVF